MDSDFQSPSSPLQLSTRESPRTASMSFPKSSTDDTNQDWAQWMRWDEPMFPDPSMKDPSESPFELPLTSPGSSIEQQNTSLPQDLSLNDSFGFMGMSFEPIAGSSQARMVPHQPGSGAEFDRQLRQSISTSPGSSVAVARKRKSTSDEDGSMISGVVQDGKKLPSKKRAHNVIEKRYRANLNEKIAELRDSVPSLRASAKQMNGSCPDDDDDGEGVTPASKLNKASILSKATEYIRHLEIRNKRLEEENTALKNRLRQLDKAADQTVTSAASVSSPSNCTVTTESGASSSPSVFSNIEDPPSDSSPTSSHPAEGLIKVPESFKRMRAEAAQGPYSKSYIQYEPRSNQYSTDGSGRRRTKFPNKYMLGALAGLMVLEGMSTDEESESTAKGLLAVPMNMLNKIQNPSMDYWYAVLRSFWNSWHARAISHILVFAGLIVGSAFVVFVYLFNAEPNRHSNPLKAATAPQAAMLSSCNYRRQAWLTSIQQVGVPRHRFFREWYVVTSRCFEYVLRCLLGWKLYSWATGITEEDEKGRVKTWDIAIDAQLAGGDAEISKSRLVLTIFAAGTLPRSPRRMMLKALHCRILLWRVGDPGSWTFHVSNDIARALARYQWQLAREMHKTLPKDHPEALPSYLAALLTIDSEEVMTDAIIQRAANLTWNHPTQEGMDDDEVFMDVVEEDPAIQSSLDALAAWWSSHLLQNAILRYFEASSGASEAKKSRDLFKAKIKVALDVAPQPSAAHTRALVMKSVFFEQGRVENIGMVLAALPCDKVQCQQQQASNFLDSSLPVSVREEISIAVRCAMIAAIFEARANGDTSLPSSFTTQKAITWFNQLPLDPVELTLLGFAAIYHLLHVLVSDTDYLSSSESSHPSSPVSYASATSTASSADDEADEEPRIMHQRTLPSQSIPNLGRVASELIYWARNAYNPAFYGFTSSLVELVEQECTSICHSAGVNVADYSLVHEEKLKSKRRKDRKKKKTSRQLSKSDVHIDKPSLSSRNSRRRQSAGSNDTGYGSLSVEEDVGQMDCVAAS